VGSYPYLKLGMLNAGLTVLQRRWR